MTRPGLLLSALLVWIFASAPALAISTVVIDAGHGGHDRGGVPGQRYAEKIYALDVAKRLNSRLRSAGYRTVMTRSGDYFLSLDQRCAIANRQLSAIFISIHFNHANNTDSSGIETFFASEKLEQEPEWAWTGFFNPARATGRDSGETLAGFIQTALVQQTVATNRGIRGRPLYVARHTRDPAVLVECGFINNPMEARMIANSGYRDLLARSIALGVARYQKSRPQAPKTPPELVQSAE